MGAGGNITPPTPPPTSKRTPKKSTQIRIKKGFENIIFEIIQVIFKQCSHFTNYVNHNKVKI